MAATDEMSVMKMNAALLSMQQQPETVCQLFAAMTAAGVVPDLDSYKMVIGACVSQNLQECGEALYQAASAQGVEKVEELEVLLPGMQPQSPERKVKKGELLEHMTPEIECKATDLSPNTSTHVTDGSPSLSFSSPSVNSSSLSPSVPSTTASPQELHRRLAVAEEHRDISAAQKVLASLMDQPRGTIEPQDLSAVYARVVALSQQVQVDTDHRSAEAVMLEGAVKSNRYDKAWQLVGQMLRAGQAVDKFHVALLLKSVGKGDRGLRGQAKRHLELVEKYLDAQQHDADEVLFNSLLDACCRLNDLPRLEKTLQKMRSFGIQPSPSTFGTLLKAYGAKSDAQSVMRVWKEMKASNVTMNPITAGCMLDACVKCGHYATAEEVFQEVKAVGLHRNTILFTTLIKGYARQKRLPLAIKAKEEMKAEGVPLNVVTYNSLIDVAIRCKDLQCATDLVTEMQEEQIQPDLITYSTLMKGFCEQGDLPVALDLLTHLRAQGIKPDEIFYNSLLEGCVKAASIPSNVALRTGLEVFGQMLTEKCAPSNITFSILVKLYARADGLDAAMRLVQTMETTFNVKPTNVVFATLVKVCVAGGRAQAAGTLLLGLPLATRLQPDQGMYATVLPVLVGSATATVRDLELGGELLRALAHAPPGKDAKPPCVVTLATQLCQKVNLVGAYVPRSKELKDATQRVIRTLAMEQVFPMQTAEALLWQPQAEAEGAEVREFVPGQTWAPDVQAWDWQPYEDEAWGAETAEWGEWAQWNENEAEAPKDDMRTMLRLHPKVLLSPEPKSKAERDENASPNVMQMLLAKSPAKSVGDVEVPQLPLSNLL